jgi:hypothetical protein
MESTTTFANSFVQGFGFGSGIIVAAGTAFFVVGNALLFYSSVKNENSLQTIQQQQDDVSMVNLENSNSNSNSNSDSNIFKKIFDDLE